MTPAISPGPGKPLPTANSDEQPGPAHNMGSVAAPLADNFYQAPQTAKSPAVSGAWYHPVLWQLAWREQRLLLAALVILLLVFGCIYTWIMNKINLDGFSQLLFGAFAKFESLSGVSFEDVATPQGKIALAFVDPVVILVMTVWGISRGSDVVAGELDRGTMEMLLAQPVTRLSLFLSKAGMALIGILALALSTWVGIAAGINLVGDQFAETGSWQFWPGVLNVISLGVMFAGVSTLVSSLDRYRWRTVGIMGGFYATWLLLKIIYKMGGDGTKWIGYLTPLMAYEPQHLIKYAANFRDQLVYNGSLMALGGICFVAAAVIFCRRDLPAPL
ncbi:MAG: ABC transporter permease [Pirellulales bacterium]|nr:ABC transporter permease [Pirellulales bacterium]